MSIINITTSQAGLSGVLPSIAYLDTSDPEATVLTAGYLNHAVEQGYQFSLPCMACITTRATPSTAPQVGWYQITHSGANWSVVPAGSPGDVTLPTIANHIATYTNTTGGLSEDPPVAITGHSIQAGLPTGTAGTFISMPGSSAKGSLIWAAVANTGNTNTTVSNVAMGQASVLSIPDPVNALARFLVGATATPFVSGNFPMNSGTGGLMVDSGIAVSALALNTTILAEQQFVGISNVLTFGTGTWTVTRIAEGDYVSRHTAGDETSIIAIDITPIIQLAASKGFRLNTFDYIYSIATLAMDAHTVTLDRIAYANNVAVSVTSVPITGTLATATQANPYVSALTVATPAFDVTADSKYVIEITANNAATTAYDFYGIMLKFSQTVG